MKLNKQYLTYYKAARKICMNHNINLGRYQCHQFMNLVVVDLQHEDVRQLLPQERFAVMTRKQAETENRLIVKRVFEMKMEYFQ